MRAAVCHAFGEPLEIRDVDLAPPGPGEVRCRVHAVAICHSDIIFADGGWGGDLPAVYGHEAAGTVLELGAGVEGLSIGDRVAITMVRHCGECPCCMRGLHGACETEYASDARPALTLDGRPVVKGLKTGAFAEEVVVDRSQVVHLPDFVGFAEGSLLSCGVITGWGAVANTAKTEPGMDVVVIGTGGVGLNAVQGAALAGAGRVIAIDLSDEKLAAARVFGATDTIHGAREDAVGRVMELTGGRGADHVFVTVGVPAAFDQSYGMLAPGGVSVLVGVAASGARSTFDPVTLTSSAQRILGSKLAADVARDIPYLAGLYREGRFKLDELVTARFRFEEINEAIAAARRGEGLRNVVILEETA